MADRSEIFHVVRDIIVETRGVEQEEVRGEAKLFSDLALESIDLLEISFRMEEEFGFAFPTEEFGDAMRGMAEDANRDEIEAMLERLETEFYLPLDRERLDGLEPLDSERLRSDVLRRFTVDALVSYVQHRQAGSA
jgi:acyl carrier protein